MGKMGEREGDRGEEGLGRPPAGVGSPDLLFVLEK